MRTHADPDKAVFQPSASTVPNTQPAAVPATPADATVPTDGAASTATPPVSIQSDKAGISVDANGNVSMHSPVGDIKVGGQDGSVSMNSSKGSINVGGRAPNAKVTGGNPKPFRNDAAQTSTQATPSGPSQEEITNMEDAADKLNIREATVSQSVDRLRQQQAAAGYSLRGDMAASQQRAQAYLAKGNAALQARDLANAQKYFDMADAEIAKLEKFLGL
jgi:hypothetical protein